jgi:exodeoxyribonuclease V gamma subunit
MLHLYQSNRLERLGALFTGMIQAMPLSDPFQPEVVMVQSRGMGRWVSLTSARACGIAAHFDFVLPAGYAWQLMRQALPDLPSQSAFAPEILSWRLMALLPTLDGPAFAPLQHYLAGGERAVFELAGRVADIFDQYLVFRPDWIRAWDAGQLLGLGEDEVWQAALWRELSATLPGLHRVAMSDAFLPALSADMLPERITLFGIASLAPMYLALVRRLAELTDVCVFLLNPCEEYWGNIVDARGQLRLSAQGLEVEPDHPLLASLGKQGRDFFDLVSEAMPESLPAFEAAPGDCLLAQLQRDMLSQRAPIARDLAADDASIEMHATHGAMRELEVLKDRLLSFFAADPSLTPADVAVLTPDINRYAPYIDSVFGQRRDAPNIPYSIADRRIEREVPLLSSFSALLELVDSRFQADAVLALLDCPALLRRFGLSAQELPTLQRWVRTAAIRWGRDAAHKQLLGLPPDATFTWRWGLDRLLLGSVLPVAMAAKASPLFDDLLPLSLAGGSQVELLARFTAFYHVLEQLAQQWVQPVSTSDWGARLLAAAEALFEPDEDEEQAFLTLREAIAALSSETGAAGFVQPISLPVLRDWLKQRLSQASPGGFLTGGVTFCAMVPMRSIPFRVLCLIGMNDGAYPRDERPVSFDLVARNPRRGDRSRRFDDRYLFLEAMLSAREKLYLSYVGLSARSNEPLPPSPLLAELLDTLAAMGASAQQLCVAHPLQPFSPACYDGVDARLASFEPSYAAALSRPRSQPLPFAAQLDAPAAETVLRLDDFLWFWRLPCRAWLSEQLGIRLSSTQETPSVREPFFLDRDGKQAVLDQVVAAALAERPLGPVKDALRGAGVLPPARLGQACLADPVRQGRRFAASLPPSLKEPSLPPLPLRLCIEGVTLVGALPGLRAQGRLFYQVRPAFSTELIECWLLHLLLCASSPPGVEPVTEFYAQNGVERLDWQADAAELLRPWLAFWRAGQQYPLAFFARTSLAYARHLADAPDDVAGAMHQAHEEWAPTFDGKFAQQDEPAIALAFRHLQPLADPQFEQLARILLLPLVQALSHEENAS